MAYTQIDYKKRLEALREEMKKRNFDACILFSPLSEQWLSGTNVYEATCTVVPLDKPPIMICTMFEVPRLKDATWIEDVRYYYYGSLRVPPKSYPEAIKEVVNELGLSKATIGIEEDDVSHAFHKILTKQLPDAKLVDGATDCILALTAVKNREEIAILRKATEIADIGALAVIDGAEPGKTELELAGEVEHAMRRAGAERFWFDTILGSGYRSAFAIPYASDKIIQKGDVISFDIGPVYKGYCGDIASCVCLGEPTKEQRHLIETVMKVSESVLDRMRPGVPGSEIEKVNYEMAVKAGLGECYLHSSGRTTGIFHHQSPWFRLVEKKKLQANMVVMTGFALFKPEINCGVRVDNMLWVREDKTESLTKIPREVIIV